MSSLKPRVPLKGRTLAELTAELQTREPRSRSKIQFIDGVPHRMRRGTLVKIPAEWFGKVTHKQTIRKRQSKDGQGASFKPAAQR